MKSPCNIEEALNKFGIVMTWPSKEQIVRLSDKRGQDKLGGNVLGYASINNRLASDLSGGSSLISEASGEKPVRPVSRLVRN